MRGKGGSVDDRTVAEVALSMRRFLAAVDAGKLSCSAAYRNRLQSVREQLRSPRRFPMRQR
jgi:hypothetical protein